MAVPPFVRRERALRDEYCTTRIAYGDDDQIVPIGASAQLSSKLVTDSTLKVYPGAPHGLAGIAPFKDECNADLLDFIRA